MSRSRLLPATLAAVALALGACAELPAPPEPAAAEAPAYPAVTPQQAERVRAEVQQRLQEAGVAADTDLVAAAASGPAAELQQLGIQLDGPQAEATAVDPLEAGVLVIPQVDGWPRWFAAVTVPGTEAQELPVLEVYSSRQVRSPYRLWSRLTVLPGAELPAFPAPELGVESLGDGPLGQPGAEVPGAEVSGDPEASAAPGEVDGSGEPDPADLRTALADLAARYASVMTDGAASPSAAQFQPDEFVDAVLARAEAEQEAVAAVASTTVAHEPYGGGEVLFAARAADGDVLAVTAVTTTTTMTVRGGAGELRPGPEVRAAAGIEQTRRTLTTRSVAALAFVVPAEQGAIRLVAVGEGLVAAEAS